MATHVELVGDAPPRVGQPFPAWRGNRLCRILVGRLVRLRARVEWLALLGPVAVDRQGFETLPPAFHVGAGDVGRRRFPGHVHRLGDRTGDEGLCRRHHLHMRLPGDAANAQPRLERTVKHRQVLVLEPRGTFDRVVLVDERQDRLDRRTVVTERTKRQRHRLVDDLEHAAAGELLVFHKRDVGLDTGGVAVHQERDRAGRGQHGGLGVAVAVAPPAGQHLVPDLPGGIAEILRAGGVDGVDGRAVHLHHVQHRLAVGGEALKGSDRGGEFSARAVGRSVQDRRDRPTESATGITVVGQAIGHQQTADV